MPLSLSFPKIEAVDYCCWTDPANWARPTITTRCTTPSCGSLIHPTEHRGISLREAALLQTFLTGYRFVGSHGSIKRQIGNAVPVRLAEALGLAVKHCYSLWRIHYSVYLPSLACHFFKLTSTQEGDTGRLAHADSDRPGGLHLGGSREFDGEGHPLCSRGWRSSDGTE